jgi:hypothetical protein
MLLANLLRTLSEDEIKKIRRNFLLSERACLIFERIAASPSSPPSADRLTKAFGITKENLYRLCSEIVDECVRILAPKEEFATLKFFLSKYLYRPFETEVKRMEKKLLREKNRERLEHFYAFAFYALPSFTVAQLNINLLIEIGKKWHQSKTNPPPDDELFISIRILFHRIGALPAKKKMTIAGMAVCAEEMLAPVRQAALHSQNPLVRYNYFQTEWKASIFNNGLDNKRIYWLQLSLEVVRKNKVWFEPDREERIELQIAFELGSIGGKPQEGLEIFKKYYHGQTPDTSAGAIFLNRFIQIAFLAKDFETAWEILRQFENNSAVKAVPDIYIMGTLMRAKLQIIGSDLDSAARSVEEARLALKDNFFLAYELPIRGLESILALKQTDLATADRLAQRNIKWLRSRRISLSTTSWIHFYQMIAAIINRGMTSEPIRLSLLNSFMEYFRVEYPDFYLLLENELP